jgi:hypothetical protein
MPALRRRHFITLLGGAAAAWPLAARAQQSERMRRIGVLMSYAADDPAGQARLLAFAQELAQSGWMDGRNVRIDVRWGAVDPERIRGKWLELLKEIAPIACPPIRNSAGIRSGFPRCVIIQSAKAAWGANIV